METAGMRSPRAALQPAAALFRSLGDPARLAIISLEPCYGIEP